MHTSWGKLFDPVTITAVNKTMGHSQAVDQVVSKLCGEETTVSHVGNIFSFEYISPGSVIFARILHTVPEAEATGLPALPPQAFSVVGASFT